MSESLLRYGGKVCCRGAEVRGEELDARRELIEKYIRRGAAGERMRVCIVFI